jgi:hypothetical protein
LYLVSPGRNSGGRWSHISTFNSHYWDFLIVSFSGFVRSFSTSFQYIAFNSHYWDFLIVSERCNAICISTGDDFQFPLLGFSYCIGLYHPPDGPPGRELSIPIIGIFLLYRSFYAPLSKKSRFKTFNSHYWDFLIVS